MVLPTLSYEDIVNEVWSKYGQLRDKKKKLRLHAIEELAAQSANCSASCNFPVSAESS